MILLEAAVEGLRERPELVRWAFKPGSNVVRLALPSLRRAILDCLYHTLFPDSSRANATAEHLEASQRDARMVVTYWGRDKMTYRLLRQLRTGSSGLYRFDAESKKYTLLTDASQEIAQYVRVQEQFPDDVAYERLFVFAPDAKPSLGAQMRSKSGSSFDIGESSLWPSAPGLPVAAMGRGHSVPPHLGSASGFGPSPSGLHRIPAVAAEAFRTTVNSGLHRAPADTHSGLHRIPSVAAEAFRNRTADVGMQPRGPSVLDEAPSGSELSPEQKQQELQSLEHRLVLVKQVRKVEQSLDGLLAQRSTLETRLERLKAVTAKVTELESEWAVLPDLSSVSSQVLAKISDLERLDRNYAEEDTRLIAEQNRINESADGAHDTTLWQDRLFVAALGLIVLVWVVAVAVQKPALVWIHVVFAVFAAYRAYQWSAIHEEVEAVSARSSELQAARERLEKAHNIETAVARRVMQQFQIESPGELALRIERRAQLEAALKNERRALLDAEQHGPLQTLEKELSQLETKIQEQEAKALQTESIAESAEVLESQIVRLKAELQDLSVAKKSRSASVNTMSGGLVDEDEADGYDSAPPSWEEGGLKAAGGFGSLPPSSLGAGHVYGSGVESGSADRSRDLAEIAMDMLHLTSDDLNKLLVPRLLQYLKVFADGTFTQAEFGPRGELGLMTAGGRVPYAELTATNLDLVDTVLRLCLLENICPKFRIPVLFEEGFCPLSPEKRVVFRQVVDYLARTAQIIFVTDQGDISGHALS